MNVLGGVGARLRPMHARGVLIAGLLVSLVPLSRRAPKTQVILLVVPERLRDVAGNVEVSLTRNGDIEPFGGFTLAFPEGLPASLRREISAPNGTYRLEVSLEARPSPKRAASVAAPAPEGGGVPRGRIEITRELSLDGTEVRVLLEEPSP